MSTDGDDYKVGYKRPPLNKRFLPGRSGNPRGRPKDQPKPFVDYIYAALKKKIPVTENGKRIRITKHEAFCIALVNGALGGDKKDRAMLIRILSMGERTDQNRLSFDHHPYVTIIDDIPDTES